MTNFYQSKVEEKPQGIRLRDIGERHFTDEIKKIGIGVRLVSDTQTVQRDGTPAGEVQFDWVSKDHWPVKNGPFEVDPFA